MLKVEDQERALDMARNPGVFNAQRNYDFTSCMRGRPRR
jgi:hypothetical protein